MDLGKKKCKTYEGDVSPLKGKEVNEFMKHLQDGWEVTDNKKISKQHSFENFKHAMKFVNKVADLAEDEGHHPDIHIYYGKVVIDLSTHTINGLSENDFILAFKIDKL